MRHPNRFLSAERVVGFRLASDDGCCDSLPVALPIPDLKRDIDMTDTHLRILAKAALHSQRRLEEHDASEIPAAAESSARRRDLETTATRAKAQFAAAQARRRYPPKD